MSLSAIILTKNEEKNIKRCLESLKFVDEIIVVDNLSTDNTVKIAQSFAAKVIKENKKDFSHLRNLGRKNSRSDWLLYVDADEVISDNLSEEIKNAILRQDRYDAYYLTRKNYYLRNHAWPTKEKMIRLIKKRSLVAWTGLVHETPIIKGKVGELKNELLHYTHQDIFQMVEKTNSWSEIESDLLLKANHPKMTWWRFFRIMFSSFFKSFIIQKGFRVKTAGIVESIYQVFSSFITYAKLWEKQNRKVKSQSFDKAQDR